MLLPKHWVHPSDNSIHTPRGITPANYLQRVGHNSFKMHPHDRMTSTWKAWIMKLSSCPAGAFLFSTGHLDNVWRDVTVTTGRWYYWQVGRGQGCCETSYEAQDRSHKMSATLRWNFAITDETWYFVCCCIPDIQPLINVCNANKGGNTMHNRTFETAPKTLTSWFFLFSTFGDWWSFPPNELNSSYPILWECMSSHFIQALFKRTHKVTGMKNFQVSHQDDEIF